MRRTPSHSWSQDSKARRAWAALQATPAGCQARAAAAQATRVLLGPNFALCLREQISRLPCDDTHRWSLRKGRYRIQAASCRVVITFELFADLLGPSPLCKLKLQQMSVLEHRLVPCCSCHLYVQRSQAFRALKPLSAAAFAQGLHLHHQRPCYMLRHSRPNRPIRGRRMQQCRADAGESSSADSRPEDSVDQPTRSAMHSLSQQSKAGSEYGEVSLHFC